MPKIKTGEREMRIVALRVAQSNASGCATTTQIKAEAHRYVELTAADLKPSATRPGEAMFHQIVGNVISHQEASTSLFRRGLAERTDDGLCITDAGRAYLKKLGY